MAWSFDFRAIWMSVYATTFCTSAFDVRGAANRSFCVIVFVFGHGKHGRTPNINGDRTSLVGHILYLMDLILRSRMCLSSGGLCSVWRMLKTLRRCLWYLSSCTISLCDSMPLNGRSTLTSSVLSQKFSDINEVFCLIL